MEIEKPIEQRRREARAFFVQSPTDQATNYITFADDLHEKGGIEFGNVLDEIIRPPVGGDLVMILGRTGNGKTSVKLSIARNMAERISAGEIGDKDSIVIFATLEQSANHIELMLAGNEQFNSSELIRGEIEPEIYGSWASYRPQLPLWIIGPTKENAKAHRTLYFETIIEAIEAIIFEYGKKPMAIFVDYLQRARMRDGVKSSRHQQVMDASEALKDLAIGFDVPVFYGSQAKQEVDNYKDKTPKLNDSMWSSDASHLSDIVFSIMRTARYWDTETHPEVEINDRYYENTQETLIVTLLKQRGDIGYGCRAIRFKPQTLEMSDFDYIDLNEPRTFEQVEMFSDE